VAHFFLCVSFSSSIDSNPRFNPAMSDGSKSASFPPASPYPDAAAAAAAAGAAVLYEPIPLPYGLDSIAPSSMSALTAEKLEKFRVGSQSKSRFQIEKEEKEGKRRCLTQ
jgi:hypothetical protein